MGYHQHQKKVKYHCCKALPRPLSFSPTWAISWVSPSCDTRHSSRKEEAFQGQLTMISTATCYLRSLISHRKAKAKRKFHDPPTTHHLGASRAFVQRTSTNTLALANLIGRNGSNWWMIVLMNGQPHYANHNLIFFLYSWKILYSFAFARAPF